MRLLVCAAAIATGACAHAGARDPCAAADGGVAALPTGAPRFDHASTLVGTVVAAGTGHAIAGAEISLAPATGGESIGPDDRVQARTDRAGGFVTFGGRGPMAVSVRASGYRPADTIVTLELEQVDTLQIALRPLPCRSGGGG